MFDIFMIPTEILNELKKQEKLSTCLRKQIGSVIVKNGKIVASGYNGNSPTILPCSVIGCAKEYFKMRPGQRNELCTGLCAEQRAILNALKKGVDLKDATLYCSYSPCTICSRFLVELGFKEVYYLKEYGDPLSKQILKLGKIKREKII